MATRLGFADLWSGFPGAGQLNVARRFGLQRGTLRADAVAGLVLGVQSVPDGLATGLLAGVSPLASQSSVPLSLCVRER